MIIKNKNLVKVTQEDIVNGELVIPSGVETIDPFAVSNLNLKSIVFPNSIKTIEKYAFMGCNDLVTLKIPDTITSIGAFAFSNCINLSKIDLPKNLEHLGASAFKNCSGLKSIEIPSSIDKLENETFINCTNLKKIILPKKLKQISMMCFKGCKNLKEIELPNELTEISENAFMGCQLLKEVVIPNSVTKLKKGAFKECESLKKVSLSNSLNEIAPEMFMGCSSLKDISIPSSVQKIREYSFQNCTSLKNVKISDTVKAILEGAFLGCYGLENINLPDNLENLGDDVFSECKKIKSIDIPGNIKSVGRHLFKDCFNLQRVNLPESLEIIYNSAFENCYKLRDINLPNNIKEIGNYAFYKCGSLKNIVLPESLETLGRECFYDCSDLESVIINGNLKSIEGNTFALCESLKNIVLPNSLEKIGEASFLNCEKLANIELPKSVNEIKSNAFEGCTSLLEINIPDGVKVLEEGVFTLCVNLSKINLPKNLEYIENSAFYYCSSLKKINLPDSIKKIGEGVFSGCSSLEELTIPSDFESFGNVNNGIFKYLTKEGSNFVFSKEEKSDSLELSEVKIPIKIFMTNWNKKELLLREQLNTNVNRLYTNFVSRLPKDKAVEFVNSHNFTFYKQLNPNELKLNIYKGLYNLGGFMKPIEVNGRNIDYAQKVVGFIQEKSRKKNLTLNDFSMIFKDMEVNGFNKEFTDFFLASFDELLEIEKNNRNFISNCYNHFEEVQKTNTSHRGHQRQLKPTIEKFVEYFRENKFKNVTEETRDIAKTLSPYYSSQETFDDAVAINNRRKTNKTPDHILSTPLSEKSVFLTENDYISKIEALKQQTLEDLSQIASNEFSFEWLAKNDPENFILGKLCNCCSHLAGVGYSIMNASIVHPSVQNLVIRDDKGVIVAKSTLFVNKKEGYGVLNNIEVNNSVHYTRNKIIYEKIMLALNEFAERYNKENPLNPLTKINVGMDNNDLEDIIKRYNIHSKSILMTLNYEYFGKGKDPYYGDSLVNQYTLWQNREK